MSSKLKYFLFHKPYKILSQFSDEAGNRGWGSLLQLGRDIYPVGRLDLDSEGLLILTNDRKMTDLLLNPKYQHTRTYLAQVEGIVSKTALYQFGEGLDIKIKGQNYRTQPAHAALVTSPVSPREVLPVNERKYSHTSWLKIELTEGKNRQVRKMTAQVNHPTLRLIRVAIEDLELGDIPSGSIRMISRNAIYKKLKIS